MNTSRTYKLKWSASGTVSVEAESKVMAIELVEDILHNDLTAADVEEFEVETAEAR